MGSCLKTLSMCFQMCENDNHLLLEILLPKKTQIKHTIFHELLHEFHEDPTSVPIFDYVLQEAINEAENGNNLYIVCNEKTNALAFKKGFLNFTNNVFCFTGNTPDPEKRNLCINLKENAKKIQCIHNNIYLIGWK